MKPEIVKELRSKFAIREKNCYNNDYNQEEMERFRILDTLALELNRT
jgi:hypothetical protein